MAEKNDAIVSQIKKGCANLEKEIQKSKEKDKEMEIKNLRDKYFEVKDKYDYNKNHGVVPRRIDEDNVRVAFREYQNVLKVSKGKKPYYGTK